ncbi:FtsX-like permease family protein [Saccharothrix yanglingensis]|uniref:ABC3 transporter permease C-terminal domain-containing protein n=1 Tax=Saccharothrix yanglingensis TaxID=659496 RepID=A0ABU0X5C3_9PSEU|nr:ABC transporter permease [Saccharothrix yanglingensis]MDQ2587320.1 hypothetical protein [Saccharothrix yanglingensis]
MRRLALRELLAHRTRTVLTLLAVATSVALVVLAWVVGDSTERSLTGGAHRTDVDLVVFAPATEGLTQSDLDRVRAHRGVVSATAVTRGYATVPGANGKLVSDSGENGGIGWTDSPAFALVTGRAPGSRDEVAVNELTGLAPGTRATVRLGGGRVHEATVVGVFAFRPFGFDISPDVAFDPGTARVLFGERHREAQVVLSSDADAARVAVDLTAALPNTRVVTRDQAAAGVASWAQRKSNEVRGPLLAFGAIAALVAALVIANAFAVQVAQRTRRLALLRAVGATRGQVLGAVLLEAVAVGLSGATLGTAVGVAAAYPVAVAVRPPGQALVFAVPPTAVVSGYAVGVLVTVLAALGAARRGASVPPVSTSTDGVARPRRAAVWVGVGLVALGVGGVAVASGSDATAVGVGAALSAWLGLLLLTPVLLSVVVIPLQRTRRTVPKLVGRGIARDPRRGAATVVTLAIGLTLVCAFATFGESATAASAEEVEEVLPATSVVLLPAGGSRLDHDTVVRARGLPGRGPVAALRLGDGLVGEVRVPVTGVDPDSIGTAVHPPVVSGRADVATGAVLPQGYAGQLGLGVGDELAIRVGDTALRLPVTGVYRSTDVLDGVLLADSTAGSGLSDEYQAVYLALAADTPPAQLRTSADRAFADAEEVLVTDVAGLVEITAAATDQLLLAVYGLLAASGLIALLGVVNTLTLSVVERRGEIGLLRVVGATPALIRRLIRTESLVLSGCGGLLGVSTGLGLGAVVQHLMLDRALTATTVPWQAVGVALVTMVSAGVLASLGPARRASEADHVAAVGAGAQP